MRGGTLFSGIGTPELAGPWIDWQWSAEIEPFASAVHATRFPNIPNLGDVREFPDAVEPVELIVFGSPCQSFSVAGKRAGLDDPRGNMALIGLQVIDRVRPDWVVFENVPGLLSSDGWRDFGTFLGALGECGYGFAYRVLDAQYAGVPQRRRRVFVVGHIGNWRPAAAVLFEPESLFWNSPPSREAGERVAPTVEARSTAGGAGWGTDFLAGGGMTAIDARNGTEDEVAISVQGGGDCKRGYSLNTIPLAYDVMGVPATRGAKGTDIHTPLRSRAPGASEASTGTVIAHSLRADGFDASEDGTGRGTPLIVGALPAMDTPKGHGFADFRCNQSVDAGHIIPIQSVQAVRDKQQNGIGIGEDGEPMFTMTGRDQHAIAFTERTRAEGRNFEAQDDLAYALCNPGSGGRTHSRQLLDNRMAVRRLTPRECERLQGFPDDFTLVRYNGKPAADGPRYRALGNAMAVPVIGWILNRIRFCDDISDVVSDRRRSADLNG